MNAAIIASINLMQQQERRRRELIAEYERRRRADERHRKEIEMRKNRKTKEVVSNA